MIRLLVGLLIGGAIGTFLGYQGTCTTGACPLTANPWRGGLYGAFMGTLFALTLGGIGARPEEVKPEVREAGARLVVHIQSDAQFQSEVINADVPVLVDFYSDSCPPCRALAPGIDALAAENDGRARVVKVNVDRAPELAQAWGVQAIPTVYVFHDGKAQRKFTGFQERKLLQGVLDEFISPPAKPLPSAG